MVQNTRGSDNVVDHALSRMFGDVTENNTQVSCAVLLDSLPLEYSSLAETRLRQIFVRTYR